MLLRCFFSCVFILLPIRAWAINGFCEEHRLELIPIYQTLIARLEKHLYTRDNNLKIDAETDFQAFMKFSGQADLYDKRMVNAIRAYNDEDPEAERACRALVVSANCEAYLVYQDAVIDLPAINRASVLAEGRRRCERAYRYEGFSYLPIGGLEMSVDTCRNTYSAGWAAISVTSRPAPRLVPHLLPEHEFRGAASVHLSGDIGGGLLAT